MAKKQTTLEKLRKKMEKLAVIHKKEETIFEEINDILDEEEEDDLDWDDDNNK